MPNISLPILIHEKEKPKIFCKFIKKTNLMRLLYILFSCFVIFGFKSSQKTQSPNIVLIFMDDMGYGDLGVTGALDYQTAELDKLAGQGMRFTNFLTAQAVCSASRAALLTGTYPNRIGIHGALMPYSKTGINASETTMAEILKQKGYATAIFGKWHLGYQNKFLPLQHGFDEYLGLPYSNDMWPVDFNGQSIENQQDNRKKNYPPLPLVEGNEEKQTIGGLADQDQLTTMYTQRAVSFIQKNKSKPFFLYLPHTMTHVPLGVSEKFKGKSKQGLYGDVMMEIDWSVGQILKALKDNGLDKNTLVIFTSDNGPWLNFGEHAGSTGGFREGKGTVFEGGVRVPCIMRWPGQIPAGAISNQLASTLDILPTVAKLTGSKLSSNQIDGLDLSEIIRGKTNQSPRKYFYYYYAQNELRAVRRDNWKLMLPHVNSQSYEGELPGQNRYPGKYATVNVPLALYDLRRDPGEEYDVQTQHPDIVEELQKIAQQVRLDMGDKLTNTIGKNSRPAGVAE
jgi:arylsulfatase A-like enzyme